MDTNRNPHGASISEATDLFTISAIPNCDGKENQNGDKQKAKKKIKSSVIVNFGKALRYFCDRARAI